MEKTELKLRPCYCGGEMKIKKVAQNGCMDGTYWNWELGCSKCGLTKTYTAGDFYGRKFFSLEEVINDWNSERKIIQENDPLSMTGFSVRLCDIYRATPIIEADKEKNE